MKWFLLSQEYNPKVIGDVGVTQSKKMTDGYDYGAENSVWNIPRKDFTDSDFLKTNFEKIKLEPSAIYTDLISSMAINFYFVLIISHSLKQYFNNFKLSQKFYKEVMVVHPMLNMELVYNAFYMNNQYNIIDFKKSEFLVRKTFGSDEPSESRKFKDEIEFNSFLKDQTWRSSIKVVNLKIKTEFDFFRIKALGGYLISEELKKGIEKEKITGLSFKPAEKVFVEVP